MDQPYCGCHFLMPQEYKVGMQQMNDPKVRYNKGSVNKQTHQSLDSEQMALLEEHRTPMCMVQRIKCL